MARAAQLGIALGALGAILALMGLFPGVTGIRPTESIGIAQIVSILSGFTLLILGALTYVKFTFYSHTPSTLAQSVGVRLSLTGLVFATLSCLADISGFGSHTNTIAAEIFLGPLQAAGMIGSFLIASIGVLIYTLTGTPEA